MARVVLAGLVAAATALPAAGLGRPECSATTSELDPGVADLTGARDALRGAPLLFPLVGAAGAPPAVSVTLCGEARLLPVAPGGSARLGAFSGGRVAEGGGPGTLAFELSYAGGDVAGGCPSGRRLELRVSCGSCPSPPAAPTNATGGGGLATACGPAVEAEGKCALHAHVALDEALCPTSPLPRPAVLDVALAPLGPGGRGEIVDDGWPQHGFGFEAGAAGGGLARAFPPEHRTVGLYVFSATRRTLAEPRIEITGPKQGGLHVDLAGPGALGATVEGTDGAVVELSWTCVAEPMSRLQPDLYAVHVTVDVEDAAADPVRFTLYKLCDGEQSPLAGETHRVYTAGGWYTFGVLNILFLAFVICGVPALTWYNLSSGHGEGADAVPCADTIAAFFRGRDFPLRAAGGGAYSNLGDDQGGSTPGATYTAPVQYATGGYTSPTYDADAFSADTSHVELETRSPA